MPGKIRKDYCAQKANANGYETLTFLSWERHGQLDDRSKGTVIMGLRSGCGDRGARRHGGSEFRSMPVPVLTVVAVLVSLAVVSAAVGATHALTATPARGHPHAINGFLTGRASPRPSMTPFP